MLELNHVHITGRLTRDPELKFASSGTAYARFRIATETGWGDSKKTSFISVTAFGKRAEFLNQYFRKGSAVYIDGHLEMNTWEDDGDKKEVLRVIARDVKFAESKRDADARQERREETAPEETSDARAAGVMTDDELPF